MSEICDCGNGVVMRNDRGETCCSETLKRYEAYYGALPLTGGAWLPLTKDSVHDAIPG